MMLRSLALAALLVLASCGSSDDTSEDESLAADAGTETSAPAGDDVDESAATTAPTTAAPTTEAPTTEAPAPEESGNDGSCLIGSG